MAGQVLTASAERHSEQFDQLLAEVASYNPDVDRDMLERAYRFASEAHEHQQRRSGEDFILHPLGVALILAELRSDDATIAGGILHDVVEDTDTTIEQVRDEFGDEVARLVEGVTKLTRIHFQSREQAQAENYRKMIVAMADDHRVILIKLADRLHNMRTIEYLGKQKQLQKARETLEVYAPLATGSASTRSSGSSRTSPSKRSFPRSTPTSEARVNERRAEREKLVQRAGKELKRELDKVDIPRRSPRARSTSTPSTRRWRSAGRSSTRSRPDRDARDRRARGKEGERDCYGALGVIHSLWKPLPVPGRFKDYIARPKFNMYRSLHTTVTGPDGRPLEIQVRTREMHRTAEQGIAAHWLYKGAQGEARRRSEAELAWMKQLADWQREETDSARADARLPGAGTRRGVRLHAEGRGEEPSGRLDADRLRLLGAHGCRPPHRRRQGERPHRPAPLPAAERRRGRDPHVEAGQPGAVARLALAGGLLARAQQDQAVVQP